MAFADRRTGRRAPALRSGIAARGSDIVEVALISVAPTAILRSAHAVAARLHLLQLQHHLELRVQSHLRPQLLSPIMVFVESKAEQRVLVLPSDGAARSGATVVIRRNIVERVAIRRLVLVPDSWISVVYNSWPVHTVSLLD
jgi:hypothetical protein